MSNDFDAVRVIDEPTAIMLAGVSPRTWDRLRARGDIPPITRLSPKRIGYRVIDFKAWLDARRVRAADDPERHRRAPRRRVCNDR
jgi:predicted DNA-binding transcriptional regulator AlpA